ncbi:MAG: DUF1643 domain-containing protein [Candidatus Melainabacteria bacterium]|nr:DUF1643 domain-containing protein [Candidatus Melainabacteria bacterium]
MQVQNSGATFDRARRYRYKLWRKWDEQLPNVVFLMLNPSKADAEKNDQTIRTCIGIATRFGFGSLEVVNLFAFCATYPEELRAAKNPIGKLNDRYIVDAMSTAEQVILAWGNHGNIRGRSSEVLELISEHQSKLVCLGTTKSAQPRHPLYVPASIGLKPYASCVEELQKLCL